MSKLICELPLHLFTHLTMPLFFPPIKHANTDTHTPHTHTLKLTHTDSQTDAQGSTLSYIVTEA